MTRPQRRIRVIGAQRDRLGLGLLAQVVLMVAAETDDGDTTRPNDLAVPVQEHHSDDGGGSDDE